MPRKKRQPKPKPVRRDSYTAALEKAESRLAKALDEQVRTRGRLQELEVEIPRLQAMIRGIRGFVDAAGVAVKDAPPLIDPRSRFNARVSFDGGTKIADPLIAQAAAVVGTVPSSIPTNVDELPGDDNAFLANHWTEKT